ncbi:hypothetical protein AD932_07220 [Gluconobacter oxydans]|nr:hypothetical protein AD932_07220 [Gluconobacter oxydans]
MERRLFYAGASARASFIGLWEVFQMAFAKMIPIPLAEVIHDSHALRSGMMGDLRLLERPSL